MALDLPDVCENKQVIVERPQYPHSIRFDRTVYRQVSVFLCYFETFFFFIAFYEMISQEEIVQFSADDRERKNKI